MYEKLDEKFNGVGYTPYSTSYLSLFPEFSPVLCLVKKRAFDYVVTHGADSG